MICQPLDFDMASFRFTVGSIRYSLLLLCLVCPGGLIHTIGCSVFDQLNLVLILSFYCLGGSQPPPA